jgi:hypothetical protein
VVKYLKGPNTPVCDLEGDVNVESDCEGDSSGAWKGTKKAEAEMEEEIRAVLITGSFAAYAISNAVIFFGKMTSSTVGSLSSSIVAQT